MESYKRWRYVSQSRPLEKDLYQPTRSFYKDYNITYNACESSKNIINMFWSESTSLLRLIMMGNLNSFIIIKRR